MKSSYIFVCVHYKLTSDMEHINVALTSADFVVEGEYVHVYHWVLEFVLLTYLDA